MPPTLCGGLAGPPVFHLVGHIFLCLHVRPCSFLPVSDIQRQREPTTLMVPRGGAPARPRVSCSAPQAAP